MLCVVWEVGDPPLHGRTLGRLAGTASHHQEPGLIVDQPESPQQQQIIQHSRAPSAFVPAPSASSFHLLHAKQSSVAGIVGAFPLLEILAFLEEIQPD